MGTAIAKPEEKKKPAPAPEQEPPKDRHVEEADTVPAGLPLFLGGSPQRKLAVGPVEDPLEKEADRVAAAVTSPGNIVIQRKCACGGSAAGECEECRKKEEELAGAPPIQRQASGDGGNISEAPPVVHQALNTAGEPLDASTQSLMESRFERDFGDVRVHTDSLAAKSASSIHALAYTSGKDLVFGAGQYSPHSGVGQRLLAHELTHVVQQDSRSRPDLRRVVRRQPATAAATVTAQPGVVAQPGVAAPPPISPEDRQRQIYAATIMREVPAPDPGVKANLGKALSFAPVYEDIHDRDSARDQLKTTQSQLDEAINQKSIATYNVKDVSGAPGGSGPGSGLPEKAAADLAAANGAVSDLSARVAALAADLQQKDNRVKRELAALGVKDEAALVTFVEDTFPNTFQERGKQVAIAQLEANKRAAKKEQERYKAEHAGTGDRQGLVDACRDLDARANEISAIASNRYTTLPPGGADPADPGVQELKQIQEKIMPKQAELEKKRDQYQLRYPILFKVDPREIAHASPNRARRSRRWTGSHHTRQHQHHGRQFKIGRS